jgi:hypothetical protein
MLKKKKKTMDLTIYYIDITLNYTYKKNKACGIFIVI